MSEHRKAKKEITEAARAASVIDARGLDSVIRALSARGYAVIGPRLRSDAIVCAPIESVDDLPVGWSDEQDAGRYRLVPGREGYYFDTVVGPQNWKRYFYPPRQSLLRMRRQGKAFRVVDQDEPVPRQAFIGVRSCDLAALSRHDTVFGGGEFADPTYVARRKAAFIVAVSCSRAGGTCFCASMGTGPRAESGFDLALTEIAAGRFVVETGSSEGAELMAEIDAEPAADSERAAARDAPVAAAAEMGRAMIPGVAALLKRNLESRHWDNVAKRCLTCANCTLVCPTCFCSTIEDVTDLSGAEAERVRVWDSCFTMEFSYIHGGSVRRETASRYRQWMTHKLSTWHDQFGVSGCVGCGRCITWCPVGIDITEEARTLRDGEGRL